MSSRNVFTNLTLKRAMWRLSDRFAELHTKCNVPYNNVYIIDNAFDYVGHKLIKPMFS